MPTLRRGLHVGFRTTWDLGKIIFPVTILVSLMQHTILLDWLIRLIRPWLAWIGLPGEAAIPLVLGNFLNLYAAIGAILALDLSVKQVFILAMMLSFSHNLFIESSVAAKVGVKLWVVAALRMTLAVIVGFLIHLFWQGGSEQAHYGLVPQASEEVSGWFAILLSAIEQALIGVLQLAVIVIPLMILIQWLQEKKWVDVFSDWMSPFTRLLGMKENTSMTLAAGLLFGLAFGAGVMLQAVKEDGVSKKDLYLAFIFLVACHAVVEDTVIFIPLGISVWPLLVIRLTVAILLTTIVATIWNRVEKQRSFSSARKMKKVKENENKHNPV